MVFCCKANIGRPCSFDSQTDRFYCAYEMCPNQCHMYYDLPLKMLEHEIELLKKRDQDYMLLKESYYQLVDAFTNSN